MLKVISWDVSLMLAVTKEQADRNLKNKALCQGIQTSDTTLVFAGRDLNGEDGGYSNLIFELTCPNEDRNLCSKYIILDF